MLYAYLAVAALALFVLGVLREPRRISNAVWLGVVALFVVLWLVVRASDHPVAGHVLGFVFAVVAVVVAALLPVALIVNGVVMLRREGHRPANLLSLLAGLLLAGTAVLLFVTGPSTDPWVNAPVGSVVFVVAYGAFVFGSFLVYSVVYGRIRRKRGFSAIIVLGSGLSGSRVPPLLASRLNRAVVLYRREHRPPWVVVSGGQGEDETRSEASAMRDHLVEQGVPPERILEEDKATTTEENLRLSVAMLDSRAEAGHLVAVTNNYHVIRTAITARRLGLRLDVAGAPTAAYFLPSAALREFGALVVHYRWTNIAAVVLLALTPWAMVVAS